MSARSERISLPTQPKSRPHHAYKSRRSGSAWLGMLRKNVYLIPPEYEFSDLGKIFVGAIELAKFNKVQEPLLLKKLLKLELAFDHDKYKKAPDLAYRLTDLKLYRAQLQRILSCTLYFLEIQTNKGTLYKIGVTQRPIFK